MGKSAATSQKTLPAPVGGLNAVNSAMQTPVLDALILENFIPLPDKLVTRDGASNWVTGFSQPVERLWVHSSLTGGQSLWATTSTGIYSATTAGAVGATVGALTNGKTIGCQFSTGAANYLFIVNGTDSLWRYDGTTWTQIATLGAVNTNTYKFINAHRQRLFAVVRNSMTIDYLDPNAISGVPTSYPFTSIFKLGGNIVATDSWTIDGGSGTDDYFTIITSQGEVAIFAGNDPATWQIQGVFNLPRPLGPRPFFKYGGDLLVLTESGIYPLSSALKSVSISRTQGVSQKIRQLFVDASSAYFSQDGWQMLAQPDVPMLIVSVPATPHKYQFIMHPETGAWATFSGWEANCFARVNGQLYFGGPNSVSLVGGFSDYGVNITSTFLSAYSTFGYPKKKQIKLIRPYMQATSAFSYMMGVGQDFLRVPQAVSTISGGSNPGAVWGAALWGTATWSGNSSTFNVWRSVPDTYSTWKAFYFQVSSNTTQVTYLGTDFRVMDGSDF